MAGLMPAMVVHGRPNKRSKEERKRRRKEKRGVGGEEEERRKKREPRKIKIKIGLGPVQNSKTI